MEIQTESFQPLFFSSPKGANIFLVWMNFLSFQEYEAITRGLVRGNPSVPVQGTADEIKQVPV